MKSEVQKLKLSGAEQDFTSEYSTDGLEKIQGRYSPASVFLITIIGIAIAEVIAMIVVYYQRDLPYYQQVAIDAAVMTVIIFPILYFLSFRPIILHIEQRYQVEQILQSRLRIVQFANTHTLNEVLQFTLDELEALTDSEIGYFHFVDVNQKNVNLQAWSTNTIRTMCNTTLTNHNYSLDKAGVWADSIRAQKVVVHNDYSSLAHRKGLPDGHASIVRDMAVPIIRDRKIVAILGMGNKPDNYSERDIELVSTLADFTWDIIKQKQIAEAQRESEEKFRTLADWTYDWELWLDPDEKIVYNSPSCERISGYSPGEMINNPELLIEIVHPEDRHFYRVHHQLIHDESAGVEKVEYRVVARNGEEHWIEHICRPVFGDDNRYLGRRVNNRDVTSRKLAEKEIEDRNQKEKALTETIHNMQLDIARDLHDTIGQNIGFLRMKLEHLSEKNTIKKADLRNELQNMTKVANDTYDLMRGTLSVLQSSNSHDLFRIFSRYAKQIEDRSSITVDFSNDGDPRSLSPKRMRQLFFVFREALTNVEKHAQAELVTIRIGWDKNHLVLSVSDNGRGFDPIDAQHENHYGLRFMRERVELLNGSLNVESTVGSGTKLVVRVPYE